MIYIFQGVQNICSLPGLLCKACGDLCSKMNCKPVQECCEAAGKQCTHFMARPLSTYVVLSLVMGICAIATDAELYVQIVGIVYICFAFYFQHKVWQQILASQHERPFIDEALEGQATRMAPFGSIYPDKLRVPQESVHDAFKKVLMEDFVVLGFFVLLVLFLFWSLKKVDPWGLYFFGAAFVYSMAWYCCKCCAGTVRIEMDEAMNEAVFKKAPTDWAPHKVTSCCCSFQLSHWRHEQLHWALQVQQCMYV